MLIAIGVLVIMVLMTSLITLDVNVLIDLIALHVVSIAVHFVLIARQLFFIALTVVLMARPFFFILMRWRYVLLRVLLVDFSQCWLRLLRERCLWGLRFDLSQCTLGL